MAGTLSTVTVRVDNNKIVLNAPALAVVTGDYFHWRFEKASVASARIDFAKSNLFPDGAHWGVDWVGDPKACEFLPTLPAFVLDAARGGRFEYYIAANRLGCSEALVVKGEIVVA
jgi:hypothetical protein